MTYATSPLRPADATEAPPAVGPAPVPPAVHRSLPFYDIGDVDIDVVLVVDRRSLVSDPGPVVAAVRLLTAMSMSVRVDPVRTGMVRVGRRWDRIVRSRVERIGHSGAIAVSLDPTTTHAFRNAASGVERHPGAAVRHVTDVLLDRIHDLPVAAVGRPVALGRPAPGTNDPTAAERRRAWCTLVEAAGHHVVDGGRVVDIDASGRAEGRSVAAVDELEVLVLLASGG